MILSILTGVLADQLGTWSCFNKAFMERWFVYALLNCRRSFEVL
ncbi:hypothetical protein O6H91_03G133700 [Diphasiastrum complanatum]|uniref:Uncharacterized protein n=1 Tax=Diphasiastrum complanatum TaxID=34168 RepID=A0ACC2EC27_DIPCM|nr:hypothetical protein O6H91_03G133700 [Diphasiastrum complanatum]